MPQSSCQNRKRGKDTSQYSKTPTVTLSPSSKEECRTYRILSDRPRILPVDNLQIAPVDSAFILAELFPSRNSVHQSPTSPRPAASGWIPPVSGDVESSPGLLPSSNPSHPPTTQASRAPGQRHRLLRRRPLADRAVVSTPVISVPHHGRTPPSPIPPGSSNRHRLGPQRILRPRNSQPSPL